MELGSVHSDTMGSITNLLKWPTRSLRVESTFGFSLPTFITASCHGGGTGMGQGPKAWVLNRMKFQDEEEEEKERRRGGGLRNSQAKDLSSVVGPAGRCQNEGGSGYIRTQAL